MMPFLLYTAMRAIQEFTINEIWQLSATEIAQRIEDRAARVQQRWWRRGCSARIDAVNPAMNAVVRVLAEDARAAAVAADRGWPPASARPLHGVPFTVKESIDVAGSATT